MTVTHFPAPSRRRDPSHFVHVYTVIRIKVAVDANDHRAAMRAADDIVYGSDPAVTLVPISGDVLDAEFAEQVTGYVVDEAGDDRFVRSGSYGPDYAPDPAPARWHNTDNPYPDD